ncbi:NERD domain-containing protein [Microbulbifer sp. JMSA004]|uniref:NERD domain-containing protein n=1 Tax=Microbulbifer sp. JMSA004 TaxID=3243370 RepID=UPI004039783D
MEYGVQVRAEDEIFKELETLCSSKSFIHVIAFFCFKDTFIHTAGERLSAETLSQQFDKSRLSRTEISSLIGLMCKNNVNLEPLTREKLEELSEKTWTLLAELHQSFIGQLHRPEYLTGTPGSNPAKNHSMREAIFYAGEGVYKHQYRDLAKLRYQNDLQWIRDNKGFSFNDISEVFRSIEKLQLEKINLLVNDAGTLILDNYLPMFQFSIGELAELCKINPEQITSIIKAFSSELNEGMESFTSIDDFNYKNAFPILKLEDDKYVSFQSYSLWESQYESPFFWFNSDKKYKKTAEINRGYFTEDFTAKRLTEVFTKEHVFTNVIIYEGKNQAAEIDVLVIFGNTAIIVQAKSKKLTIAARKGNSLQLKDDFKKAVEDACKQAYLCATLLEKNGTVLKDANGNTLQIENEIETIYPFCIVSDYYPAISAQAREFLKYTTSKKIKAPYVMDVFLVDLLAEILSTPLFFLDYIRKRTDLLGTIISHHELVIFSFYLAHNLNCNGEYDLIMLDDNLSADLELAMLARREGGNAHPIPPGILTYYQTGFAGTIIDDIKRSEDFGLLNLGYFLLSLNEESINQLNIRIKRMIQLYEKDKKNHDVTFPLLEKKSGITIHCNSSPPEIAFSLLCNHCELRKYSVKAETWHGICFSPLTKRFRFSTYHSSDWEQSDEMDALTSSLRSINEINGIKTKKERKVKTGRNQKCPCGSNKKYKQCCL